MPNLDRSAKKLAPGLYQGGSGGSAEYIKGPVLWSRDSIQVLGTVAGERREFTIPLESLDESTAD
jgi:hypothetical protein